MYIVCLRDQLQKSITLAEKYISKTSSIPALQGILLDADKNILTIRSTDLDTGFETTISAQVKKPGSVVIPGKTASALVSSLKGEKVNIETKGNMITVTTKNTATTVKGYRQDEFPKLPKIKNGQKITVDAGVLLKNIKNVYYAASQSNIKPEIESVYFNAGDGDVVKMVATDSFRLAEKTSGFESKKQLSLIFPLRNIVDFTKVLENFSGKVELLFDNQQLFVSHPSFSYFTRLIDGTFPDYRQIIPASFTTEVVVNKEEFGETLKLANIFSGRLNEVKFRVYPQDNVFEVTTSDSEVGEHVSHISAKVTGEPLEVSFNQRYVSDGLQPIGSDSVILRFGGETNPLLMQDLKDPSFLYLVMPMKNT